MIRKKLVAIAIALCSLSSAKAYADEGMWLMQQLQSKYPTLKEQGLKLKDYDLYNPNGTSLKDAVVIFDRGCTGEIISSQGLVLTNHHCGYDAIQQLSSVEQNYLKDGFWAKRQQDELPCKGVKIRFIDKIEDVTDYVRQELASIKDPNSMAYLSPRYLASLVEKRFGKDYQTKKPGTEIEIKAFYNGNKYLMFTKKVYSDIRFVGAPPSAIGKFGADTDNWSYPRHVADFSIFRIYADANGNPAPYSPNNIPLKPKRWFNISTKGVKEGDFAMIMGFPGSTYHFNLPSEVQEWKEIDNDIRIRMRGIRQQIMLQEMLSDPKINIMYAAKYAYSQNGYKRAIGANWGIERKHLGEAKAKQMNELLSWAKPLGQTQYQQAVDTINNAITQRHTLRRALWYLNEGIFFGIEFASAPLPASYPLRSAKEVSELLPTLEKQFASFYDADYSPNLDKTIAKALLTEYCTQVAPAYQPEALREGIAKQGSIDAYIDHIFASSIFSSPERFASFRGMNQDEQFRLLNADPMIAFVASAQSLRHQLGIELAKYDDPINRARKTFVAGLIAQHGEEQLWPDANFTLRFTYGKVKGYSPRDAVYYHPQTYLSGVIAKEDSTSWEFQVPERLKEIYRTKAYGKRNRWGEMKDGKPVMPVDFIANTHTTGGNSGSPVFDGSGNLIGINFDRTWEGVGGDIQYLPDYQRSIICDIRYILMLIQEYGNCDRLIKEMTLI